MAQDYDRKRSFEAHSDDEQPSLKKFEVSDKPLQKLSEDGPLTQQDVVYFQKEAIWRQMNHYKRQLSLLTKDLNHFKVNYEANELKLNIVDSWYEQIINLFGLENRSRTNEHDTEGDGILVRLSSQSTKSINYQLDLRREHLIQLLRPILENTKLANISSESVLAKLETLNAEFITIKSEKETLSKLKVDLETRLEALQQELIDLHKERERKQSKTLRRVDESLVDNTESQPNGHANGKTNGQIKPEDPNGSSTTVTEQQQQPNIKADAASATDMHQLEEINIELEQLKSVNATLQQQLDDITNKFKDCSNDNVTLQNRLSDISEDDLKKSSRYVALVEHNSELSHNLSDVNRLKDQLIVKVKELENSHHDLSKLINGEVQEENESLKNQLNKSESDLVRIRTTRDELLSKQAILKSEIDNKQTNQELHKLNKVLSQQIESLQQAKHENEETPDKYANLDKGELIKRIVGLSAEIKEIELAFQETREVAVKKFDSLIDHDNMIKKLTIEKTKADQKYFASMRLKDSLSTENKILKSQMGKSQELINKMNEMEKSYLSKIDVLTKSINDYKSIKESSMQENSTLQESVKLSNIKRSTMENELKSLNKASLESNQQLHEHQATIRANEVTISKLESKMKQVESLLDKYKTNNTSSLLQEDEKQLEALRSIAKCSVCSKNWKDTAITVCGHVFCSACTQERLAARLRRCPSCNRGFSANDLLSVHL